MGKEEETDVGVCRKYVPTRMKKLSFFREDDAKWELLGASGALGARSGREAPQNR